MARATRWLACAVSLVAACATAPPPAALPPAAPASAAWPVVRFAHGRARVSLPPRYEASVTEAGPLGAQTTGPGASVHLLIGLHALDEFVPDAPATLDACVGFLRDRARQKDRNVVERGDRAVLMEPGVQDVVGGFVTKNLIVQICVGHALFTVKMTVREIDQDKREVKQFFEDELDPIVASLRGP
jgi:hypothetical protein